jgi:hypothetical protein
MKKRKREIHHSEISGRIKHCGDLFSSSACTGAGIREDKKMPANGGRAQPKIGPRDSESGAAHRCAARLSAITHIGCMYADEASIGGEYDPDMTRLKQTPRSSRTNSAETGLSAAAKKKPAE